MQCWVLRPGSLPTERGPQTFQKPQTFRVMIWLERRAERVLLRCSWHGRGPRWQRQGDRGVSAGAHRHQLPCSLSRGTPRPTPPFSPPSLGCYRLEQRQDLWLALGAEAGSWRPATPVMPADPSEHQQTILPRCSLLSYPLPDQQGVPAALPCPNRLSPLPDLVSNPATVIALLHSVAKMLLEASITALSLSLCLSLNRGAESLPTSTPPPPHSLRTDDTPPTCLLSCCLLCWGMLSFFRVT